MSAEVEQEKIIGAALTCQFEHGSLDIGTGSLLTEQGRRRQGEIAVLHEHVGDLLGVGNCVFKCRKGTRAGLTNANVPCQPLACCLPAESIRRERPVLPTSLANIYRER